MVPATPAVSVCPSRPRLCRSQEVCTRAEAPRLPSVRALVEIKRVAPRLLEAEARRAAHDDAGDQVLLANAAVHRVERPKKVFPVSTRKMGARPLTRFPPDGVRFRSHPRAVGSHAPLGDLPPPSPSGSEQGANHANDADREQRHLVSRHLRGGALASASPEAPERNHPDHRHKWDRSAPKRPGRRPRSGTVSGWSVPARWARQRGSNHWNRRPPRVPPLQAHPRAPVRAAESGIGSRRIRAVAARRAAR